MRSASLVEYLARRYRLDVILFREETQSDPVGAFPRGLVNRIEVIRLPKHSKALPFRALRNLERLVRGVPPLIDRFAGFERHLEYLLGSGKYDVAVLEHFWSAPYHGIVAKRARRVVLDLHNIESEWHERNARAESWPASAALDRFAQSCKRLELDLLRRFDLLLTPSEREAGLAAKLAPMSPVAVYPNAVPLVPRPLIEPEHSIIFTGNLEYRPNLQAVEYFRTGVWPPLRRADAELRWRLGGRNAQAVRQMLAADPRIEVIGPMADAVATLAASKIAVVPLVSGSGTRVKILEAWAAGVAVVSTRLGAEGLDAEPGEHLLIADDANAFFRHVTELLRNDALRRRLAGNGRKLYEARFTWPCAWQALEGRL